MLIAQQILALLADHRMSGAAIRAALPAAKRTSVAGAITRLRDKGLIESAGWGSYRLVPKAAVETETASAKVPVDEAVKARMMAGR
jgi:predicted transcriptional regulator